MVASHPLLGSYQCQHPNLPFRLTTHPRYSSNPTSTSTPLYTTYSSYNLQLNFTDRLSKWAFFNTLLVLPLFKLQAFHRNRRSGASNRTQPAPDAFLFVVKK